MRLNWKIVAGIVGLAVALELFVFNFRYFESLFFAPVDLPTPQVGAGFVAEGDGVYRRQSEGEDPMTLTFTGIGAEIHNIYSGVHNIGNPDDDILVNFEITDASHKYYYQMPTVTIMGEVEQTKYFRLHLNGESHDLQLLFSSINHGDAIQVDEIVVNARVPLFFLPSRLALLLLVLAGFYLLRPTSGLYRVVIGRGAPMPSFMRLVTVLAAACAVVVFWWLSTSDPSTAAAGLDQDSVYNLLAQSLLNGRLDLDLPVSEELLAASWPYDHDLRVVEEVPFFWDMAFYGGKYYLYFGATPVVLFSLPYLLLTQKALPMYVISFLFCCIFVAGVFLLLYQLIRKYFERIPYVTYLLLCVFLLCMSNMLFLAKDPSVYNVSVLSGVGLCVLGFGLWLLGMGKDKLHAVPLGFGSLCVALVAGCRPSLLLLAFFAVPLFWKQVFHTRELFSKKGWLNTVVLAAPFVVVGALLMAYNYLRFGSAFEFGHSYILTLNDISGRAFMPENVGQALFYYFLQPPAFTGGFPYLVPVSYAPELLTDTFTEPMYGGVLASFPLLWCLPLAVYFRKELKARKLYGLLWALVGAGVVLACIASTAAGLTQRYMGDFFFVIGIAGILMVLALTDICPPGRQQSLVRCFVLFGVVCAVGYAFCLVFTVPGAPHTSIRNYDPNLFYRVMRRIQFWM